jgi:hypothetical protein
MFRNGVLADRLQAPRAVTLSTQAVNLTDSQTYQLIGAEREYSTLITLSPLC